MEDSTHPTTCKHELHITECENCITKLLTEGDNSSFDYKPDYYQSVKPFSLTRDSLGRDYIKCTLCKKWCGENILVNKICIYCQSLE